MAHWTSSGDWMPGRLIGDDGCDTDIMAKTATHIPRELWRNVTDARAATSTGHVVIYDRPAGVCVGWGGFDDMVPWQEAGRTVCLEMVAQRSWSMDSFADCDFISDSGALMTVENVVDPDEYPSGQEPVPLYDALQAAAGNKGGKRMRGPSGASPTRRQRQFAPR